MTCKCKLDGHECKGFGCPSFNELEPAPLWPLLLVLGSWTLAIFSLGVGFGWWAAA
jgi:hypothetical protein